MIDDWFKSVGFRKGLGKGNWLCPSGSADLLSKKSRFEQSVRDLDHFFDFSDVQG